MQKDKTHRSDEERFRQFVFDLDKAVYQHMGLMRVVTPNGKKLPDLTVEEVRNLIKQLKALGLL